MDVFLRVRVAGEPSAGADATLVELLSRMYIDWAKHRGMQLEVLASSDSEQLVAVSGLECAKILESEVGLHVLELVEQRADGDRQTQRLTALVEVAERKPSPHADSEGLLDLARAAFEHAEAPVTLVRRYRLQPDPLGATACAATGPAESTAFSRATSIFCRGARPSSWRAAWRHLSLRSSRRLALL